MLARAWAVVEERFSLRLGQWVIFDRGVGLAAVVALSSWLPIFLMRGTYSSILRFSGGRTMVGLTGKGKSWLCESCDADRVARHRREFAAIAAAAAATPVAARDA